MKKYIIFGTVFTNLLTGGVRLNIFATTIDRGVLPMLSVDENTPMSAVPNAGTWCPGALNSTRYFDVSIAGKCSDGQAKINFQAAEKIPSFFTKNAEGKIVFAAPQVVGMVKAAKGHNSWVQIDLKTINGSLNSDVAKHVCLGIKKNDEADFFDIIHAGHLTSRYVDVTQESYVELVPLISKTSTGASGYTAVTPGDEVAFTDITISTTGEFNFGSVYRVNVSVHNGQWLTDQTCDLVGVYNDLWLNCGRIGVGAVIDKEGVVHQNRLLTINSSNRLAYSSDGTHWVESGSVNGESWFTGPIYGNGVWCSIANNSFHGIKRSIDGGKIWSGTLANIAGVCLGFANGVFMTIMNGNPGIVYTSVDAEIWTQVGSVKFTSGYPYMLVYGADKWICGSDHGYVYQSKDGKTWDQISDELCKMYETKNGTGGYYWYGGCYVNGYFYVIRNGGEIVRSSDGKRWERVLDFSAENTSTDGNFITSYYNITYYKNKLWAFARSGSKYTVGLFNPDGSIVAG